MKVSIITASFNSSSTIANSIESVNGQTYKNIEHIFVDGLSSDGTVSLISELSKREKIISSDRDNGIYDALNKGLALATGEVIGLVHSDDVLASSSIIEDIVYQFKSCDIDGVYGDLIYVKKNNTNHVIRYWKGREFNKNLIFEGWMPAHPTLFLKRDVYNHYGGYDTSYKIAADYQFVLRILKNKKLKLKYLPKIISKMRIGGASNKNFRNILLKSQEDLRALKQNKIGNPYGVLLRKNTSKLSQLLRLKESI